MVRLGSGNYGRPYMVNLNNSGTDEQHSSSTTQYNYHSEGETPNNTHQFVVQQQQQQQQQSSPSSSSPYYQPVSPAPSSGGSSARVLSMDSAMPRAPSSMKSNNTPNSLLQYNQHQQHQQQQPHYQQQQQQHPHHPPPPPPPHYLTNRGFTSPGSVSSGTSASTNNLPSVAAAAAAGGGGGGSMMTLSPTRGRSRADSDQPLLPTVSQSASLTMSDSIPRKPHRAFLAAETGKGSLLPDFNHTPTSMYSPSATNTNQQQQSNSGSKATKRHPPDRNRTRSSPSLKLVMNLPGMSRSTSTTNNDKSGSGSILPTHVNSAEKPAKLSVLQSAKNALRRRTPSGYSDDEDNSGRWQNQNSGTSTSRQRRGGGGGSGSGRENNNNNPSPYRTPRSNSRRSPKHHHSHHHSYKLWSTLDGFWKLKLGNVLQLIIIVAVIILVFESHHKALFASEQLAQFKDEENLLLLHLQQIERQSISLHENLARLATSRVNADATAGGAAAAAEVDGHQDPAAAAAAAMEGAAASETAKRNGSGGGDLDLELIRRQTQQLYQMEDELNHELRTLEARIQSSSRNHIIQEFGEGPVQVVLDLDFGDHDTAAAIEGGDNNNRNNNNNNNNIKNKSSRISILLWHDTPHAAWTWLEQIGRHVWDGADFTWQQPHVIDATPRKHDTVGGKIEFVEQSQHGHEAWTVGLKNGDGLAGDGGGSGLSMYINLQDNTHYHKHETCVGKVIDGFDALQRLLEVSRNRSYDKKTSIKIKAASAMHVTKREAVA